MSGVDVLTEMRARVEQWEVEALTVGPDTASWPVRVDLPGFDESGERTVEWVRELVDPFTHRRVLDFGCGAGRLARFLQHFYRHVIAVDASPLMASACHARCQRDRPDVDGWTTDVMVDDGEGLIGMMSGGTVDAVVAVGVLERVPRLYVPHLLAVFSVIVEPGGPVVFTLPIGDHVDQPDPALPGVPFHWWPLGELEAALDGVDMGLVHSAHGLLVARARS